MEDAKKKKTKATHKGAGAEAPEEQGVLYVGMDLGTSRTSIASSNGIRESTFSVVGYPKDVVSRKLLRQEVLFGEEAIKNRLSLNFFRPLEKGVIKGSDGNGSYTEQDIEMNMNAARDLVKHAITLARPRSDELIYGVIGCPSQSSIKNKSYLIEAAKEVLDSVMVCSEPFAVAYGMDWFSDLLVIDIGAGTVDLCRMHGTLPEEEDQITLETAGDYIDAELARLIEDSYPEAQFSENMIKSLKERHATVMENTAPIEVEFPVAGKPELFDITVELKQACRSIIPPMVNALGKLIATFDPEFQMQLKDNVLLGGGGSQIHGLAEAVEAEMIERLGHGRVVAVEEPVYAGANGALKIAHDMPPDFWDQLKNNTK
ncbi:MAG: MamK family actin-like protein [Planctomycetota bacterium]|jgi:rod shape-determining protein MreB